MLDRTFWQLKIAVLGVAKRDADLAQASGWWAERFAREKVLQGLGTYQLDGPDEQVDDAENLKAWAKRVDARFSRH